MATLVASFQSDTDTQLTSPSNVPTIRIRRTDTQALVITDSAMTEQGEGNYAFDFTPSAGLEYSVVADGDPLATGQTVTGGRFAYGSLFG